MVTKAKRKSSGSIPSDEKILKLTPKDWSEMDKDAKLNLYRKVYDRSEKALSVTEHLNNIAFEVNYPNLEKELKSVPKRLRGNHDEVTLYDGVMAQVVDSEGVTLWARVGPVFHGDKIDKEPGVWLQYQSRFMASKLEGPVLLSMKTWNQLTRLFNASANRQRRKPRKKK